MQNAGTMELGLQVADVSGQKVVRVNAVPPDTTVGEFIEGVLPQMRLSENDAGGRPLVYNARLEREGRHLHGSERMADAVVFGDRLVLQPNVEAGGNRV